MDEEELIDHLMSEIYLEKILWWVRFMVIGLIIWASTEGFLLMLDHI